MRATGGQEPVHAGIPQPPDAIVPFAYLGKEVVSRVVDKFIHNSNCNWPIRTFISVRRLGARMAG
jgi:hypothetical protein